MEELVNNASYENGNLDRLYESSTYLPPDQLDEELNPLMENLHINKSIFYDEPSLHNVIKSISSQNLCNGNLSLNNDNNNEEVFENESFYDSIKLNRLGPDEEKLKDLIQRTGYSHMITAGQRKYGGPPPGWDGIVPSSGCEVYCGKIPKDIYEDELIPLFEGIGKIWDFRLMIDSLNGGISRGFAFVQYVDKELADKAVKMLSNYEIRPGKYLKLNISIPNLRLFVGNIPKSKSKDEIFDEFTKLTEGLVDVIVYSTPGEKRKNRGFCFLQYESHLAASIAKKRLTNPNYVGHSGPFPLSPFESTLSSMLNSTSLTPSTAATLGGISVPTNNSQNNATTLTSAPLNPTNPQNVNLNNYWPFKRIWNCDIIVEWAQVQEEPPEETMAKVKVLYVSNLTNNVSENDLKDLFEKYGTIQHVKKVKDYAFVHFSTRDEALEAMKDLQEFKDLNGQDGIPIKIALAKPPLDSKKKAERIHGIHGVHGSALPYGSSSNSNYPAGLKMGNSNRSSLLLPGFVNHQVSHPPSGKSKSRYYSSQFLANSNPQYLYYLFNYGQPFANALIHSAAASTYYYPAANSNGSSMGNNLSNVNNDIYLQQYPGNFNVFNQPSQPQIPNTFLKKNGLLPLSAPPFYFATPAGNGNSNHEGSNYNQLTIPTTSSSASLYNQITPQTGSPLELNNVVGGLPSNNSTAMYYDGCLLDHQSLGYMNMMFCNSCPISPTSGEQNNQHPSPIFQPPIPLGSPYLPSNLHHPQQLLFNYLYPTPINQMTANMQQQLFQQQQQQNYGYAPTTPLIQSPQPYDCCGMGQNGNYLSNNNNAPVSSFHYPSIGGSPVGTAGAYNVIYDPQQQQMSTIPTEQSSNRVASPSAQFKSNNHNNENTYSTLANYMPGGVRPYYGKKKAHHDNSYALQTHDESARNSTNGSAPEREDTSMNSNSEHTNFPNNGNDIDTNNANGYPVIYQTYPINGTNNCYNSILPGTAFLNYGPSGYQQVLSSPLLSPASLNGGDNEYPIQLIKNQAIMQPGVQSCSLDDTPESCNNGDSIDDSGLGGISSNESSSTDTNK